MMSTKTSHLHTTEQREQDKNTTRIQTAEGYEEETTILTIHFKLPVTESLIYTLIH